MNDFQRHATNDYYILVDQRITDVLNNYNSGGKIVVNLHLNNA